MTQYNKIAQAAQPNTASVGVGGVEFGQNVSDDQKSNSQKPTKLVPARGKALGLEKKNTPDRDPEVELAPGLTKPDIGLTSQNNENNTQKNTNSNPSLNETPELDDADSESADRNNKLVPARGRAFGLEKENTPDLDPDAEFAIGLRENTADPNDQENGGTPFNSASDRARAKRLGLS